MTITEFATLKILQPYTFQSREISDLLNEGNKRQSAWSGYPLYFFNDASDESLIYLVSGWKDVHAHLEWIASDVNQELIKILIPLFEIKGLVHLEIDFEGLPAESKTFLFRKDELGETGVEGDIEEEAVWIGSGKEAEVTSSTAQYYLVALKEMQIVEGKKDGWAVLKKLNF